MKRPLTSLLATTIVAAFHALPAAALPVSEDVPVAGLTAVARALGIEPPPDRGRFIAEITRVANQIPLERRAQASALARRVDDPSADPAEVPVPLTTAIWSDAVFGRALDPSELVSAIIADRNAALLCHGLAALDDETLQYLANHPDVLSYLHGRAAPAFAGFASSLRIRNGRVVTPGGADGIAMWEKAVGEDTARPDRFIRELFSRNEGRIAYLYDGIGGLDAAHQAFAVGAWIPEPLRWNRFNALLTFVRSTFREWKIRVLPFTRPVHDVVSLLMRVEVAADGTPAAPASRAMWSRALESAELPAPTLRLPADSNDALVDAAWLAEHLLAGEIHDRRARLDQFSFGQRAFSSGTGDRLDILTALRAFARYPMLMLTLDRLSVVDPPIYAAAARHAARLSALDRRHGSAALAQYQSVLALITRMRQVRSLDPSRTESLIRSLSAVPVAEDGYRGRLLEWFDRELRSWVIDAGAGDVEAGLMARLAGAGSGAAPVPLEWEGGRYRLDLAFAEQRRLSRIRERQGVVSLDLALDLASAARAFVADDDAGGIAGAIGTVRSVAASLDAWSREHYSVNTTAADPSRELRAAVAGTLDELARPGARSDPRREALIFEALMRVADTIAADALLSMAYAVNLGDPDGPVLSAGNVAKRHDFGLDLLDAAERIHFPWTMPRQDVAPGVPWHVSGSALGLDVALAPVLLRRVDATRMAEAPRLTTNERQTFATGVGLLNPYVMTDADRDAVASAIARGLARVQALTPATLDAAAAEIRLDGWRRRAVQWSLAHDPSRVPSLFSLTDALHLGGPPPAEVRDAWGMSALQSSGCLCTRMQGPSDWWNLTGRPQLGLLSTAVADVNLRVAVALHDLGLPAAIARDVLSAAVQDYIDEVRPSDKDDWLTLVRTGRMISTERVEDYVAAVTADGPLVPDVPLDSPNR